MNGQSFVNWLALAEGGGSLFMIVVGLFGSFDGFALFGNCVCLVGNVLWAYFIVAYNMNDTTAGIFALLAAANTIALGSQVRKCTRSDGKDSDSDSEDDEDSEERRADGAAKKGKRGGSGTAAAMKKSRKKRQRIHAD